MQNPLRPVFCLVIEENPVVGLDLADALDASGYYVAGPFTSGRVASAWLAQFTPDIAVLDMALSDGQGIEIIRELQARATPFIIYAAQPSDGRTTADLLAVPWVEKPASAETVKKALRDLRRSLEVTAQSEAPCCTAAKMPECRDVGLSLCGDLA
jgi:DNA-binding response OmpR family regulator